MIKDLVTKLANFAIENPAKFLKRTAAVNFSMGSVGLIIGMLINDKIPQKEKRYMIAQESVEGMLDLGVFLYVASKFENWGKALLAKQKIIPRIKGLEKKEVVEAMKKFFANPDNPKGLSEFVEGRLRNITKGTEVAFSLIGTIIAFNIITPLIRNYCASWLDKLFAKKIDRSQVMSPILPGLQLNDKIRTNNNDPFAVFESRINNNYIAKRPVAPKLTFTASSGMKI